MPAASPSPRARHRPLLVGFLLALALGLSAQAANAASSVFWTNFGSNTLGRAGLAGTSANQSLVTERGSTRASSPGANGPFAIAVLIADPATAPGVVTLHAPPSRRGRPRRPRASR